MCNTTVYARSLIAISNLHLGVLYAYLTMFLVIVFCIFVKNKYPDSFTSSTAATVQDEDDNNEASLTEKIQRLSTDDRYQYYNELFNKTGNQIELSYFFVDIPHRLSSDSLFYSFFSDMVMGMSDMSDGASTVLIHQ